MVSETISVGERRYGVLMVTSRDVRMVGLRTMFEQEALVRVVGETGPDDLVAALIRMRPDAVVVCGDASEDVVLQVAETSHDVSRDLSILVFIDAVDYGLEIALGRLQVASFVLWQDVNPVSLHWLLGGTLEAGLRVVSPKAVEEVGVPPERRRRARDETVRLTDRERLFLRRLVRGLSDEDLAREIDRAPRTVRRLVSDLEGKLGVSSRAELIARAGELGFRE